MGIECKVLDCDDNKDGVCQDERVLACYAQARALGFSEADNATEEQLEMEGDNE